MTKQEAIETIRANWPPENYTLFREALGMALNALEIDVSGHCTYYEENGKKPSCTHDCQGCTWYC